MTARAVQRVERIVAGGEGLVRIEGAAVLLSGVVPGDLVELEAAPGRTGGAWRGRVVRVLERSPDRVDPRCAVVDACGGCPIMRLSEDAQARAKEDVVRSALPHGAPIAPIVRATAPFAYRDRARLRYVRGRLGYLRGRAREVVEVAVCPVLGPAVASGVDAARRLLPALGASGELRVVAAGERAVLAVTPDADPSAALFQALEAEVHRGGIRGAVVVTGGGASRAEIGDVRGEVVGGDGRPLAVDADGFAQASSGLVPTLARALVDGLAPKPTDTVLELYAGAGTWTVALAPRVKTILAVESDPRTVRRLEENVAVRGLANVRVQVATALTALERPGKTPTLVVLDPPRRGARDEVARVAAQKPRAIAYVSCDPATLGRDLRVLAAAGYAIRSVAPYDLMPQTAEVEALALLTRT